MSGVCSEERLDAIDHPGFLRALGDRGEAVPRARQAAARVSPGSTRRWCGEPCTR